MSVQDRVEACLRAAQAGWRCIEHAPISNAEEAAEIRGTPLAIGGKSLVMKVDDAFGVFVISAALQTRGRRIMKRFKARSVRFATREELDALTGLAPGAVPPFGRPVFDLPLYAEASVLAQPEIAFTVGDPGISFVMSTEQWARAAAPDAIFEFAR